jgi:hypothetical protein
LSNEEFLLELSEQRLHKIAELAWIPLIITGLGIIIISLAIGIYTSTVVADYFSNSKAIREAAGPGSQLVAERVFIETTFAWLPGFKFLGMGLLFTGIILALAVIILTLKNSGMQMLKMMGAEIKALPKSIMSRLFPLLAILGLLILTIAFGTNIWQATIAASYWNNSIATTLNPAPAGSPLLTQLSTIQSLKAWVVPLKFLGIATLLTSISFALFTIQEILKAQSLHLLEIVEKVRGREPAA